MKSASLDANAYVIENDQILFSTQHGRVVPEIKE